MTKGIPNKLKTLQESFNEKYYKDKKSNCWIIKGKQPYSKINHGIGPYKRKHIPMHRAAWLLYRGEIPEGLWVLHTCHNNVCCNPNHLYLGDRRQNEKDKVNAGSIRGEKHPKAALTEKDVKRIKKLIQKGLSNIEIAKLYPVKKSAISKIRCGRTWGWV